MAVAGRDSQYFSTRLGAELAASVAVLQGVVGDGKARLDGELVGEWTLCLEQLCEVAIRDPGHLRPGEGAIHAAFVNGEDVRVFERHREACFALEAREQVFAVAEFVAHAL